MRLLKRVNWTGHGSISWKKRPANIYFAIIDFISDAFDITSVYMRVRNIKFRQSRKYLKFFVEEHDIQVWTMMVHKKVPFARSLHERTHILFLLKQISVNEYWLESSERVKVWDMCENTNTRAERSHPFSDCSRLYRSVCNFF